MKLTLINDSPAVNHHPTFSGESLVEQCWKFDEIIWMYRLQCLLVNSGCESMCIMSPIIQKKCQPQGKNNIDSLDIWRLLRKRHVILFFYFTLANQSSHFFSIILFNIWSSYFGKPNLKNSFKISLTLLNHSEDDWFTTAAIKNHHISDVIFLIMFSRILCTQCKARHVTCIYTSTEY